MPIILCTGYSEVINKKKIDGLGINAFLQKPATMNVLLNTVHSLLSSTERLES